MAKTTPSFHIRAYVNPLPGYSEAAQRADILKSGPVNEWYVESQRVTRADFIKHLRAGDRAVVANFACLAKTHGRIDSRLADLLEAAGDIRAKGCILLAQTDLWVSKVSLAAARAFLLKERNVKNGSARKINLTDAQVKRVLEICDSKRYTNDPQRLTALKKEGIDIGRTYMVTTVPVIARERGITI